MRRFSAQELRTYLEQCSTRPMLLDVREPWEVAICKLPDAECIPMRQVPARMQDWPHDREIVVICHHGIRSAAVGRHLEQHGFSNVINLDGGVDAWAKEVDPNMATY